MSEHKHTEAQMITAMASTNLLVWAHSLYAASRAGRFEIYRRTEGLLGKWKTSDTVLVVPLVDVDNQLRFLPLGVVMGSKRMEGLERLNDYQLDINHPYYLHYRTLFADLSKASLFAKGRLLDIGCGNKPYEKMFGGRITEYLGCDVIQSSDKRVDIICPATLIPLEDASVNTVLCTQVIEHVADHRGLVQEAHRLLRAGGVLILSGPMYWPLHEEPYDFFRFTKYGFRYLLEDAGFVIDTVESNGGKWALCGQVLIHTLEGSRLHRRRIIKLINRVFAYFDDRRRNCINTMNYVVVAHKP
jgi:SAM-dependent methyltransferase